MCLIVYNWVFKCMWLSVFTAQKQEEDIENLPYSLFTYSFRQSPPGTGAYMFEAKDKKNPSKYLVSISICSWELVLIIFFRTLGLFSG